MIVHHPKFNGHYLVVGNEVLQSAAFILGEEGTYLLMIGMSSDRDIVVGRFGFGISI